MRLSGQRALVTGASRGIGEAIAEAFVREGAQVAITARSGDVLEAIAARLNATGPGQALARPCHTGQREQVIALLDWLETQWGEPPTILVNNAATNPYFGPMLDVSDAAWDKTFEVNLKGYFETIRQLAPRLQARGLDGRGSVINVASVLGQRAAPLQGVYGMTKAAILSMTQTLAFELAPMRVNAIAPGLVETRFAQMIVGNEDLSKLFTDRAALRRHAQPEELTGAAIFLASAEASFITGQTLIVDGGFSVS